jgi:oxygen-dependent protoporphyrinogen oxidase
MKRIAIIGGGSAGLSAAYRAELLRRAGAAEYTVFEQSHRLGGVIHTEIVDDCVVEGGPDSFLSEKPAGAAFCRDLGLGDQLIGSNDADRKTTILIGHRRVPLPDGLQFLVPTRIVPMAFTPLFSWGTKLRFAQEWFASAPEGGDGADESVASFVRRHFGPEVVDRLADPLLSGIYGGSADRLSVRAVLPRMVQMEEKHGSLIRAMLAARRQMHASQKPAATPRPLFTSLRRGMQQMIDAAVAQLDPASIRLNTEVRTLEFLGSGWRVHTAGGAYDCDGVVLAAPAYAAGALLWNVRPELARLLEGITYSSSITVVFGYDAETVRSVDLSGFGFLVPRSQGKRLLACTFVHHKFPHRAPPNRALLRCFIGGENAEAAMPLPDAELAVWIRGELREILGLAAEPRFVRVYRWRRAMAQYEVGHLKRMDEIRKLKHQLPGLALAGNAYHGIGVPDCIRTGAESIAELTATTPHPATA